MNVAYGGTLFQHIEEDLPGAGGHEDDDQGVAPDHEITIEPGTLLRTIAGTDRATVNSYHHQSVAQVASGFRLAARASDGVIEAMERTDLPFYLGVQWHPERMASSDMTRRLIGALADAARGAALRGA